MADEPEGSATAVAEVAPEAAIEEIEEQAEAQPEAETEQPTETLESLTAKLQERNTKLAAIEQQLRSAQGVARGKLDTDAKVERYGRELGRLRELIEVSIKGQATGDIAQVEADLARIQQTARQETVQTAAQERASQIWGRYIREAEDAGVDVQGGRNWRALEQAEGWQEANALWSQGYAEGDPSKMNFRLMEQAHDAAAELRRAAQIKVFEEGEASKRRASGELRTPALRAGAGGSALADTQLEAAVAKGTIAMTPEISARLQKYWNQ